MKLFHSSCGYDFENKEDKNVISSLGNSWKWKQKHNFGIILNKDKKEVKNRGQKEKKEKKHFNDDIVPNSSLRVWLLQPD